MVKPTLTPLVQEYITDRVGQGRMTRTTGATARCVLAGLAEVHGARPVDKIGSATIERWLATIGHLTPGTRRMYLSRVKGFTRWLVRRRLVRFDPCDDIERIKVPRSGDRAIDVPDVTRLLMVLPDARARAIVWLMVGCGLRRVEVSRLQVGDYNRRSRTIHKVDGKGHHKRDIPVPTEALGPLDAYLATIRVTGGPFIRSYIRPSEGLAAHTIGMLVTGWMYEAGIKDRPYDGRSGHALRHTCGSDVYDNCGRIEVVAEFLGHADESTARIYTRRARMEQIRPAVEGRDYLGDLAA